MKQKDVNKALLFGGLTAAAVAAASVTAYLTTRMLVQVALDRNKPLLLQRTEGKIARDMVGEDFLKAVDAYGAALAEKPHELVELAARDGSVLLGHWFPCKNAKRAVIAMHGWRSAWYRDFGMISDFLFEKKCSVLFVEQRGQNDSGGEYMGFGLTERYDCVDWVRWAADRCGDKLPIYLLGVSMGATTVLMATGLDLPMQVHGVIADCGFTSPYEIWKHVANNNLHITFGVRGAVADALCRKKIGVGTREYSTVKALEKCTVPVMFVHGAADSFVPIRMTYENYRACVGPKKLLVVPGADHTMSYYLDKEEYEEMAADFFKKYD